MNERMNPHCKAKKDKMRVSIRVASHIKGPWFESSDQKFLFLTSIYCQLFSKDENKEKRGQEWPI